LNFAGVAGGSSEIVIADPPSADPALRVDVLLIHQARSDSTWITHGRHKWWNCAFSAA